MAGLDSSSFERDFEVAQVTLSIYRQRPLKSVDMRLALSLVKRSGGHPVWNVSLVSTSSTSSTCACSGDQAFLHPPLQKAWMKLKSSQSSGMISFLLYYCTHVLNESLKTRPWNNHCFVRSCNFLTTWKLMAKSKQYPVTLTTRWHVHFTLGFDITPVNISLVKFLRSLIFIAYTNVRNTSLYQLMRTKYFVHIIFVRKDRQQKILTVKNPRSTVLWIIIVLIILNSLPEVDWVNTTFFFGLGFIFLLSLFKRELFAFFPFSCSSFCFFSLHELVTLIFQTCFFHFFSSRSSIIFNFLS